VPEVVLFPMRRSKPDHHENGERTVKTIAGDRSHECFIRHKRRFYGYRDTARRGAGLTAHAMRAYGQMFRTRRLWAPGLGRERAEPGRAGATLHRG
jgi:hypothetical protein